MTSRSVYEAGLQTFMKRARSCACRNIRSQAIADGIYIEDVPEETPKLTTLNGEASLGITSVYFVKVL